MPRIQQLPSHVITKIAAGEVIERPASVVKELLENSVDAGSTRIDIELEQGGTELIRIVDDGCGIAAEDLRLAFSSHATSKLQSADDLFNIHTMGFRGEALASIAGIGQVVLQSRPPEQENGAELRCDGGDFSELRPWGGSPGTRIEVRHLFYNVPVRKKFLKSIATELGHVSETVTRLALANPTLHLTLRHNGKLVYEIPATAGLADRIQLFFGGEIRDALLELDSGPGPMRLSGFIADPAEDRGNAKLQYLFVNGRWFRDRNLSHAFQEAYRGLLMTGRYAVGFLFLEVPPDSVDVNVHPTKSEVRFRDNSSVYSLVRGVVKARLLKANLVPKLQAPATPSDIPEGGETAWTMRTTPRPTRESLFSPRRGEAEETTTPWEVREYPVPASPPISQRPILPQPATLPTTVTPTVSPTVEPTIPASVSDSVNKPHCADVPLPQWDLPPLPVGAALQVHNAYIVLEDTDGMLVIDQHALHERILYEQLRRRIRDGKLEVQRLLIPEPIELPAEQAAAVIAAQAELTELGLEVSEFGGNTILLSSYPTLLSRRPPYEILQSVIDYLVTKDRPPVKEVLLDHLLATMACKAAVKAGDPLTQEEITYLLHLRTLAEDSHHCPHGRPTSLLFSRKDLDKQFKRI
ncbi:MAG: DNA mismatch repair endonuclease MutL [Bacteroidales bacterium]|nr:DNA mismatch repair endonuclease MutL [Bacteroidales bacterium]